MTSAVFATAAIARVQQLSDFGVGRLTETGPPAFDDRVAEQGGVVADPAFAPTYAITFPNSQCLRI